MSIHSIPSVEGFDYRLFGLTIRSAIELPELPVSPASDPPDVRISLGRVPDTPAQSEGGPHKVDEGLLLAIGGVGRFFVKDGSQIIVKPDPEAPDANIRLFLLGSAMGALLHQRRLLPLHANAVEIDGKAVAFMGESGAGKSTLAGWFHDRGYRIIADDVCVVRFDEAGKGHVSPGLPRLRLWREALEASGRDASRYNLSYAGSVEWEKYDVPIPTEAAASAEVELAGAYVLGAGKIFQVTPLLGIEAAEAVFAHTYRGGYVELADTMREYWASCAALVRGTPVFSAKREWALEKLDDQADRMLEHARRLIASGSDSPGP